MSGASGIGAAIALELAQRGARVAITEIDARLRSHLSAGLVCGIEPADRALRLGILDRKLKVLCRQEGVPGGARPEVLEFIADRFTDNTDRSPAIRRRMY